MTVIPRLRAMSPVRMEVGAHLLAAVEDSAGVAAFATAVVWRALHRGKTERVPKDHSLSMATRKQRSVSTVAAFKVASGPERTQERRPRDASQWIL